MRRYSTFRNDLPFLVWQRYFTKASSAPVVTRSRSKCPMKSTCVSQHCVLNLLLLMWSSPAALVNVKLSASILSNVPKSFFSHAAYHLRSEERRVGKECRSWWTTSQVIVNEES